MSYLKKDHFNGILEENGHNPANFDHFERLSSKAVLFSTGSKLLIIYVNTIIFDGLHENNERTVKFETDGWQTVTSKKWINRGLDIFGSKLQVFQKNYIWYLGNHDRTGVVDFATNEKMAV